MWGAHLFDTGSLFLFSLQESRDNNIRVNRSHSTILIARRALQGVKFVTECLNIFIPPVLDTMVPV